MTIEIADLPFKKMMDPYIHSYKRLPEGDSLASHDFFSSNARSVSVMSSSQQLPQATRHVPLALGRVVTTGLSQTNKERNIFWELTLVLNLLPLFFIKKVRPFFDGRLTSQCLCAILARK